MDSNRAIALFLLDFPDVLHHHLDITLECDGGQAVRNMLNVISRS